MLTHKILETDLLYEDLLYVENLEIAAIMFLT